MNASESDTDTTQKRRRVGLVGAGSHAVRNILSSVAFLPFDLVAGEGRRAFGALGDGVGDGHQVEGKEGDGGEDVAHGM